MSHTETCFEYINLPTTHKSEMASNNQVSAWGVFAAKVTVHQLIGRWWKTDVAWIDQERSSDAFNTGKHVYLGREVAADTSSTTRLNS